MGNDEASRVLRAVNLGLHYLHRPFREILQAACVVEIEVGEHDVAHVSGGKSELLNSIDRGVFSIELNAVEMNKKRADARIRRLDISRAQTGIHENQSPICFD